MNRDAADDESGASGGPLIRRTKRAREAEEAEEEDEVTAAEQPPAVQRQPLGRNVVERGMSDRKRAECEANE